MIRSWTKFLFLTVPKECQTSLKSGRKFKLKIIISNFLTTYFQNQKLKKKKDWNRNFSSRNLKLNRYELRFFFSTEESDTNTKTDINWTRFYLDILFRILTIFRVITFRNLSYLFVFNRKCLTMNRRQWRDYLKNRPENQNGTELYRKC